MMADLVDAHPMDGSAVAFTAYFKLAPPEIPSSDDSR
jgi:hypothetical protein